MFTASSMLAKAMRYTIPRGKKRPITNRRLMFGMKKKTRYYLTDKDYYWNVYLKSDHWKQLKAKKLKENPICENCQSPRYLDVHHVEYRHLYNVTTSDLKTLCRRCHTEEHNK